ncbi:unnamed protein product [Coccothraustes coccothraustes]
MPSASALRQSCGLCGLRDANPKRNPKPNPRREKQRRINAALEEKALEDAILWHFCALLGMLCEAAVRLELWALWISRR